MHPQSCLASDQARATLWSFSSYPHDWAPVGCVAPPPGCSNSPWVRASAMQRKYAAPICLHSPGAAPACSVLKRNCERNMCQLSGLSKYKVRSLSNIYNVWKQQKRGVAVARVSVRMVLDLARYRRPRSGAALSSGQHGPRSGHGGLQQHAYRPRTPECISRIAIGSVRMTPPHSHRHTYTHARVRFHRMASRFSPPRSVPRPAHQKPFFLPGSAITRPVTHCTLWASGGKTRATGSSGASPQTSRPDQK